MYLHKQASQVHLRKTVSLDAHLLDSYAIQTIHHYLQQGVLLSIRKRTYILRRDSYVRKKKIQAAAN